MSLIHHHAEAEEYGDGGTIYHQQVGGMTKSHDDRYQRGKMQYKASLRVDSLGQRQSDRLQGGN